MTVDLSFLVEDADVQALLLSLELKLGPVEMGGFMSSIVAPYLKERVKARFENEGDDAVGKWAPLAPATVESRIAQGYGGEHPINIRTHELENFILAAPAQLTLDPFGVAITIKPEASGKIENKLQYAQATRPVLGVGVVDLEFILTEMFLYVDGTR